MPERIYVRVEVDGEEKWHVDVGDIGQDRLNDDAAAFWGLIETAKLIAGRVGLRVEVKADRA